MAPEQLIQALAREVGLSTLEANSEGVFELVFDENLEVEIVPMGGGSHLLIRSNLGQIPEESQQQADYLRRTLNWNMANLQRQEEIIALDENHRECWIYRLVQTDKTDQGAFCVMFEDFLNSLQWWRQVGDNSNTSQPAMPMTFIRP